MKMGQYCKKLKGDDIKKILKECKKYDDLIEFQKSEFL